MVTFEDVADPLDKFNRRKGQDGKWILKDRYRYKGCHRRQDQETVRLLWPPNTFKQSYIHVDDTTPAVQKKFRKAMKANASYWNGLLSDMAGKEGSFGHGDDFTDLLKVIDNFKMVGPRIDLSSKLLSSVESILPKVDGKLVIDTLERPMANEEYCSSKSKALRLGAGGLIIFGIHFRMVAVSVYDGYDEAIDCATRSLATFPPPPNSCSIRSPQEVCALYSIGRNKSLRGRPSDFKEALDALLCSGAAARLLLHYRDECSPNIDMRAVETICDDIAERTLQAAARLKLHEQTQRPMFSLEEANQYEKELGIGLFSEPEYVCGHCGFDRPSQLDLCAGCKRQWYCGRKCQKAAWPEHKCHCKENWRKKTPFSLLPSTHQERVEETRMQVCVASIINGKFVLCCIDPITEELFDALTDSVIACVNPHADELAPASSVLTAEASDQVIKYEGDHRVTDELAPASKDMPVEESGVDMDALNPNTFEKFKCILFFGILFYLRII